MNGYSDNSKLHPKLTFQLFTDEKCFGPGVALLLEKVKVHSSLRRAAIEIGMSYSKAWTIIRRAEEHLGFELLVSKTGGAEGGGATLTDNAEHLLTEFRQCEKELNNFMREQYKTHFSWLEDNSKFE